MPIYHYEIKLKGGTYRISTTTEEKAVILAQAEAIRACKDYQLVSAERLGSN